MFWPDLATAHYARATATSLTEAEVPTVTREMNPPNVPQLRPIEDFWGFLKQEVYTVEDGRHLQSKCYGSGLGAV